MDRHKYCAATFNPLNWDFGDDGTFDATGEIVTYTPTAEGVTNIRLRVADADGQTNEIAQAVDVGNAAAFYTLRVLLTGPGSVSISPLEIVLPNNLDCDGSEYFVFDIAQGTVLDIDANAFAPAAFVGWDPSDCDSVANDQCTVTMTTNRTITATFR